MYGILKNYRLGFLLSYVFICCNTEVPNTTASVILISFFEYGIHVEGEEVSLAINGYIPPFTPIFTQNVTPQRSDLEQKFTYLRAEYVSPMSAVDVVYNDKTFSLSFYVRFPFLNIPFGIVGYSVKPSHSRTWNTWRRNKNHVTL
ncbi:uncharacterized protein LOC111350670 [Spodoptera litura]|uniref:Uncharacterized protein LOC111350670 n=1 Tax=Spodoptera litura TaxID=69820 RepID=A0A9J7DT91_SPOLT|nr:uncharacterized protein LOC111350670 [Spodoptera litura]